jgi:uncharacterized Zn finger protein
LARTEPARAATLYETFIAGCHEKAEEIDDSDGEFGTFVGGLFCGWIQARQVDGANRGDTARLILKWMDDDPYGFCSHLEVEASNAFDREGLAAFERQVLERLAMSAEPSDRDKGKRDYALRRWGEVLKAIYQSQKDVEKYVELCQRTFLDSADCERIAKMLISKRKPEEALSWVDRGLKLQETRQFTGGHELPDLRRVLLQKLGRSGEALESAWQEFQSHPATYTYETLMRYVPKAERSEWHEKAMAATEKGPLHLVIDLLLETKETDRLVERLRRTADANLEELSHYTGEPLAKAFEKTQPELAARIYRALGIRILKGKKSKYYDAALAHFESAQRMYQKAGLLSEWNALAAEVREEHHRKTGFMPGFERLASGVGPSQEPSFLERARSRWTR